MDSCLSLRAKIPASIPTSELNLSDTSLELRLLRLPKFSSSMEFVSATPAYQIGR
jgi:hypothetical protein